MAEHLHRRVVCGTLIWRPATMPVVDGIAPWTSLTHASLVALFVWHFCVNGFFALITIFVVAGTPAIVLKSNPLVLLARHGALFGRVAVLPWAMLQITVLVVLVAANISRDELGRVDGVSPRASVASVTLVTSVSDTATARSDVALLISHLGVPFGLDIFGLDTVHIVTGAPAVVL
jgi:hypothetical protein